MLRQLALGDPAHLRLGNRMPGPGGLDPPQHRSTLASFNPEPLLIEPAQMMHGIGIALLRRQLEPVQGDIRAILLKTQQSKVILRLAITPVRCRAAPHVEPNMLTLEPSQRGSLVWQFDQAGTVDFACLIPGHFEAGMVGTTLAHLLPITHSGPINRWAGRRQA